MLGDIIILIMIVGYVVGTTYVCIDYKRWRKEREEKEVDYDELMRMIEKYRAELGQSCNPGTEKPTDEI